MTALQPFDKHPASPGALAGTSGSLAGEAAAAQGLDSTTRQAYSPVTANWHGMGAPEAEQAGRRVSQDAEGVRAAVAQASVGVACWAGHVQDFNDEVDRIIADLVSALAAAGSGDRTDDEVAAARQAARRQAEARWHQAYDTHIVTGRGEVQQVFTRGPDDALVLELFQAGLLSMAVVNLFPNIDFTRTDWSLLFANLRARGIDPLSWAVVGTFDPAVLRVRLDLLRTIGVPPNQYRDLLQMYWVALAAQKAGIDLSQWDPSRGAGALSDIIKRVYTYYGNLFVDHPYLLWAGMANMVGPSFAAGFFDLGLFRRVAQVLSGKPGVPFDMSAIANISDHELRFFETTFLRMQRDIFYDQAMMHEAYLDGGLVSIEELRAAGLIDSRTAQAWAQIDEGRRTDNTCLLQSGNALLLRREQEDIIQDNYQRMYDRPVTGPAFTYLMTALGEPSVPEARSFADWRPLWVSVETPGPENIPFVGWDNPLQGEVKVRTPLPDGNIAHFTDRWELISEDTLPAYQELVAEDPERAREIVSSDVGDRIDHYRLHHRIDDILWHFGTDWGVDFDQ